MRELVLVTHIDWFLSLEHLDCCLYLVYLTLNLLLIVQSRLGYVSDGQFVEDLKQVSSSLSQLSNDVSFLFI